MGVSVSKSLAYAALAPAPGGAVSKAVAYVALSALPGATITKAVAYIVLREGDPPEPDVEAKASKALVYVVMEPGSNGPLTYVTSAASEVLTGGLPSARVTGAVLEVLARKEGAAIVSGTVAEVLSRRLPAAFISGAVLEVLRSTAEVTVSALVSTVALDIMAVPPVVNARVSSVIVEVLMPASDDTDVGSVWALG